LDDPYQHTLTTKIVSVEGNRILLEETIAFSFSGGQKSDAATINGTPVLDSVIENNLIYYFLADGSMCFQKFLVGGTHVKSTAEVGFITLKRKNTDSSKE